MTDLSTYGDDEKLSSILDVLKQAGLFGEIVAIKSLANADDVDQELNPEEEEDNWVDIQTKYGHDTEDYVFGEVVVGGLDGWTVTPSASTISLETEPVSGHDWVSPVQHTGHALVVTLDGMSECGKPLTECSNFECKHDTWVKSAEWLDQERYEFKQDWNSIADRPTENFFMGLPGLRYIEQDQEYFTRLNTVCSECNLYTPSRLELCQNCDKKLVSV
jgi:hypothetical protein